MEDEKGRLENIAKHSLYAEGVNVHTIRYSGTIFERHIKTGPILELGPAEGVMTEYLASRYNDLTAVEGSVVFCESLRRKLPQVKVIHSLFEEYSPDRSYESVILGHVLEHVVDPVDILKSVRQWIAPSGRVCAAVPNAHSLHRQAAVLMGLLRQEDELNDLDRHHGHRRVYNSASFMADFLSAGFSIEVFGGYWIKPLANSQIEKTWTKDMIDAFMALGERYPDIAAELYVVARK